MKFETTKLVNIYPTYPIVTVTPPIRCPIKNVRKTIPEIRECIIKRAEVEEILNDGTVINLDFSNYDKDNSKKETIEDLFKNDTPINTEKKEWESPKLEIKEEPDTEVPVDEKVESPVEEEAVVEDNIEPPVEEAVVEEPNTEAENVEEVQENVSDDDKYGL